MITVKKETADKLIFRYTDKIFGFALDKLHSIDGARELASDITCEVYGSFLKANEIANIDGYVYRIAKNVYSQYVEKQRTGRRCVSIDEISIVPEVPDSGDEEMHRILRQEIGFLSERQRLVIYMHYYGKKTAAEIAEDLNISQGTVKWHLSDARNRLKEGINMNINEQGLDIAPIIFTQMGHDGSPGQTGDTSNMFDSRLKMNIAWACYHQPKTLSEIARAIGVPNVYIADDLAKLVEYAYIDKLDNTKDPKYRTNMMLYDSRQELDYGDIFEQAAQLLCEKYFPDIFKNFESDPKHWGLCCDGGDVNYLKYDLVMLALLPLQMFDDSRRDDVRIKRPDGGCFAAFATVSDEAHAKNDTPYPYWACGYMTRSSEEFEAVSIDCRYADRQGGWADNLNSDWEYLVKFIKKGKDKLSPEEYKRLCDKGYLYEDRVMPTVLKAELKEGEQIYSAWERLAREKITVPEEIKVFAKHMDEVIIKEDLKHHPKHMRQAVISRSMNELAEADMLPRVIEKLLERGELKPLTDIQKKTVFSILIRS